MVMIGKLSAGPLFLISLIAAIAAWLLARTHLKGWVTAFFLAASGIFYLFVTVGRAGNPLLSFLQALHSFLRLVSQCTIWPALKPILPCVQPDFSPTLASWNDLSAAVGNVVIRVAAWFKVVRSGSRIVDPLVAPFLWGIVLWSAASWAAWWVRRREASLVGMLPALALLTYNIYYTNSISIIFHLVFAAGTALLLQAAVAYQKSNLFWNRRKLDRVTIEPPLIMTVISLTAVLMLAGAFLPNLTAKNLSSAFQRFFHRDEYNALAESLGLQQTPVSVRGASVGNGSVGISSAHKVGAGPHLTREIVMYVKVDGYSPLPPDIARYVNIPVELDRYYWRAQTYDSYLGYEWFTSASQSLSYDPDAPYYPSLTTLSSNYKKVTQHVERAVQSPGILFAAGDLLSSDQSSLAVWRASGDLVDSQTNASAYTAVSRIQYVTVGELRAAGNDYSAYIRSRYLALPQALPQRVRDLALDLTLKYTNSYDRVMAIQNYLRKFPYSLDVPAAPRERDIADFFLFDLKRGYCDYFATTMAVLTRAAGIPSRMVTGYSTGSYDFASGRFVVVEADSHAWVEIYFPGLGWLEFEPTPNLAPIARPGGVDITVVNTPPPASKPTSTIIAEIVWEKIRYPLALTAIIGTLIGLFLLNLPVEAWLLSLRPTDKAFAAIFRRLYRRGRRWGINPAASRTPSEFMTTLKCRLERADLNEKSRFFFKLLCKDLDQLEISYNRLLFGPLPLSQDESRQAIQAWSRIRRSLGKLHSWKLGKVS